MASPKIRAAEGDGKARECKGEPLTTYQVLKKILPAAGGSFIEWYEFAMYSYLSSYITANFFADGRGGSLATWAGFAITFAVRPLGGAVFGHLADRHGRKPVMQLTIAAMLFSTVLQGCLPSFHCCGEGLGWFGMALLLLIRVLQGLSAGGELSTAAVYISEVSPKETLGFNLSWVSVSGAFGAWAVAALVVLLIESVVSHDDMIMWGWRIPYLTSIIPGAVVIYCRRWLEETPDFEVLAAKASSKSSAARPGAPGGSAESPEVEDGVSEKSNGSTLACTEVFETPWQELMANHKLALLIGSLGCGGIGAMWYVPPVYGVQFIARYDGLPSSAITCSELVAYVIPTLLAVPVGMLVDKWGVGRVYVLTLVVGCILAPLPLFYWWTHTPKESAIVSVFVGQVLLGFATSLTTSVYLWVIELFPVRVRATGVAVAYNIGIGVFGGMGPLISDAGNEVIDPRGPIAAPALFTLVAGLISLAAVGASFLLSRRGHLQLTHIRHSPYW